MSLLNIAPDIVSAASRNLESLGTDLRAAAAAAASPTTAVLAPAVDEVSEAITALFGTHAQEFQAVSARAAAFHDQFVTLLNSGVAQYVRAEVANVQQSLAVASNLPLQRLLSTSPTTTGLRALAAEAEDDFHYLLNIDYRQPLGPLESFATAKINLANYITQEGTGFLSGGFRLNTPFGSTPLFVETGSWTTYADGSRWVSYLTSTPGVTTGVSTYFPPGSVYSASLPQGLTLHLNGLNVAWPGSYFGGFLPNVSTGFVNLNNFLNSNALWPLNWGTIVSYTPLGPGVPLINSLGLAFDPSIGNVERILRATNQFNDLVGGVVKTVPGVGYFGGVAIQQWGDVAYQLGHAVNNPSSFQTTLNYAKQHPYDALVAGSQAVVNYIPKLVSNLLPAKWW